MSSCSHAREHTHTHTNTHMRTRTRARTHPDKHPQPHADVGGDRHRHRHTHVRIDTDARTCAYLSNILASPAWQSRCACVLACMCDITCVFACLCLCLYVCARDYCTETLSTRWTERIALGTNSTQPTVFSTNCTQHFYSTNLELQQFRQLGMHQSQYLRACVWAVVGGGVEGVGGRHTRHMKSRARASMHDCSMQD